MHGQDLYQTVIFILNFISSLLSSMNSSALNKTVKKTLTVFRSFNKINVSISFELSKPDVYISRLTF